MGNMIECIALNCNMSDNENDDKNSSDSDSEKEKKSINDIEEEAHYLEMQDGLEEYSRHYEENSVENSVVVTESA